MKTRDLRHIQMYTDKKGQTILYNARKKEGIMIPSDQVSKVAALQYRYFMVLAIAILLFFLFNIPWHLTVPFTIILTGMVEYVYRVMMLKTYTKVTNYTPANYLDKSIGAYKQSPKAIVPRILAYGVLAVMLVMSIQGKPWNEPESQVILVVAAFAAVNSIYHLYHFILSKKR